MRSSVPLVALVAALAACRDALPSSPQEETTAMAAQTSGAETAPSGLVTATLGEGSVEFWPFTGHDFSGTPSDPVNLIFAGHADPRALRAALMMLDGNRTALGFPDVFPFNCAWKDAIGGMQTSYVSGVGWVGSAIQLECGDYGPVRFHLRLFGAGAWTIANAHFEVLIPGTTEHQVLSWELAEQLVLADFVRSGLLDPALPLGAAGAINPAPFREIPAVIYNGLPVELRGAIGGPLGNVADPVPIGSDGQATILNVAGEVEGQPLVARQDFVITFDQVIPKPFCVTQPGEFLYVNGPVRLRQHVVLTASGTFRSQFHALGHLDLTPVDVSSGTPVPVGETYRAHVVEHHKGVVTDEVTLVSSLQLQAELPPAGDERGRLEVRLQVGPGASSRHAIDERCAP